MNDRFKFRIPMFTDKGTFMEFQYLELGDFIECTFCGTNGEPQQCTGLKDKNGKLIYEGDIVKDLTYLYNVRYLCVFAPIFGGLGLMSIQSWKDYNFCRENWEDYYSNSEVRRLDNRFKLANQGNKLKCFSMRELKMMDYEVIGNIYENPKLLEAE